MERKRIRPWILRFAWSAAPCGLGLAAALTAAAQTPVPAGSEFQINTYTTDDQENPSVAVGADGDFVVVWETYYGSGTDAGYSVQGQRFASDRTPLGSEFQINTYTTNRQQNPSVAVGADGDFVVVWQSYGSSGTDTAYDTVQGQRFASDGTPLGSEFLINTYTSSAQENPSVAAWADGDFVVVWQSYWSSGTDTGDLSVHGQRFASDGTPLGSEFQINTYTTDEQENPSVAAGADGDFVVVWQSYGSSGTDSPPLGEHSVQGQRFSVPEPSLPLSCALAGAVVALLARRTRGHPTTVPRRSGRRSP